MEKLVRSHAYFENGTCFSQIQLEANLVGLLDEGDLQAFEEPPPLSVWPEMGSRAFIDACHYMGELPWWELQEDVYRYLTIEEEPLEVRIVIFEFLCVRGLCWV